MLLCSTYKKNDKQLRLNTWSVSLRHFVPLSWTLAFTSLSLSYLQKKNLQIGISTWWFTNENHSQNAQLLCCIDLCLKFCMNYKIDTFIEFIQRSLLRLIINRHSLEKSTTTRQDFSSFRQKSSTLITFSGTKTCELSTTARGWSMISIIKPRSGMKWAQNIYLG